MPRTVTVREFIQDSLVQQIEEIGKGTPYTYHAFALDAIAIEFLGKVLAQRNSLNISGYSQDDFKQAISTLFPLQYHQHADNLYDQLRCGMLHFFGPKSRLALGEEKHDPKESHLTHSHDGKLILIFEVFHSDFKKAVEKLFTINPKGLDDVFLNID